MNEDSSIVAGGGEVVRATGGCDCGGVRYRITGELRGVVHCHCISCRRITGHHLAATAAHVDDLEVHDSETLTWYQRTAETRYGFCSVCGSTLFWSAADKPLVVAISGGTLDQPTGLATILAVYTADASDFHSLDTDIESYPADRPDTHSV